MSDLKPQRCPAWYGDAYKAVRCSHTSGHNGYHGWAGHTIEWRDGEPMAHDHDPRTDEKEDRRKADRRAPESGEPAGWREVMKELADEVELDVKARYDWPNTHPAQSHKYDRDMEPVVKARAILAPEEAPE